MSKRDPDYYRKIGSLGGKRTVELHGREHMSEIGKAGFRATLRSVGGQVLAKILGESYQAKFGHPPDPEQWQEANPEKDKVRAQARRRYPTLRCSVCGKPATARHHVRGVEAGNAPENIEGRCQDHHGREAHRARRR